MENNKPITLVREDFINSMAMLINKSELPMFIIEDVLRQLLNGVSTLAVKQLERDRQTYAITQMQSAQTEEKE
jgi:hypothetical protein